MDLGWVLGGALRLVRRGRVLLLGMLIALLGLVYVAVDTWARVNDRHYLDTLLNTLGGTTPPNLGLYLGIGLVVAGLGGLAGEAGLVRVAGRRTAALLPPAGEAAPRPVPGWRLLPRLLAVALWIWWPLLILLALVVAPIVAWLLNPSDSTNWALIVLGSACCTSGVFLIGWWILWPINRLANCAALLDGLPARQAARAGRTLWRQHLGSVLGLWVSVCGLNVLLFVVSAALAGLGAGVVWEVLQLVNSVASAASVPAAVVAAVLVGLLLLAWDGAVTAFNLNTWVLAYCNLRSRTAPVLLPSGDAPGGQALGRGRLPPVGG